MQEVGSATSKHATRKELADYYNRGQSVILYQHRPQMTKTEDCIRSVLAFQNTGLKADFVYILAFPKYTNRFYFFFTHSRHHVCIRQLCEVMENKWSGLCHQIQLQDISL